MSRTAGFALVGALLMTGSMSPSVAVESSTTRLSGTAISATVPTRAAATIDGRRMARQVGRPTVLQRRTATGWAKVAAKRSGRDGAVAYPVAPATTTTYRIIAPTHRVRLTRGPRGHATATVITLRAWTGPARVVTPRPAQPTSQQPPAQHPAQQPAQQPPAQPTQQPPAQPTRQPTVELASGVSEAVAMTMSEPVADASGRFIAFTSSSPDLVAGDDNRATDVFLLDTATGTVELVSRALDGTVGDRPSYHPAISADGQHVGFASSASDLTTADTDSWVQVYVLDRPSSRVELISKAPDGTPGDQNSNNPTLSRDGSVVAFDSFATNIYDVLRFTPQARNVFRLERASNHLDLLTFPRTPDWGGASWWPSISDDGERVTFLSENDDLVPGDDNDLVDVFLYDASTLVRRMVSRRFDGGVLQERSERPTISGDGGTVVWSTDASGVVPGDDNDGFDAFRYDVAKRTNTLLSAEAGGRPLDALSDPLALDATGATVVLTSSWQAGGFRDALYVADVGARRLTPLWTTATGRPVRGRAVMMSADGSRIMFVTRDSLSPQDTDATDDLYVWNRG